MKLKNILLRTGLFTLILTLGTGVALFTGETTGLALSDLSNAPVKTLSNAPFNDSLYAVLDNDTGGVYRSDDEGRSWQRAATLPAVAVNSLEIHPTNPKTLFVGTTGTNQLEGSLWYSNDKGQSWQRYKLNLPANSSGQLPAVSALAVDPNHSGILYVGTQGRGLFKVQSGYAGFESIGSPAMKKLYVNQIVATPASPVYAVTSDGLIVVEDNDLRRIDTLPDAPVSLAVDPSNPQILYAGTVGYGLHRSVDGGQSWQPLNSGLGLQPGIILRIPAIAIDKDNPRHLALATAYSVGSRIIGEGIYESFNGGQHWVKIGDMHDLVNATTIEAGGVYVATDKGLTRYGNPLPAPSPLAQVRQQLLNNPSTPQAFILVLTIALGGLVLLGRVDWLSKIQKLKAI